MSRRCQTVGYSYIDDASKKTVHLLLIDCRTVLSSLLPGVPFGDDAGGGGGGTVAPRAGKAGDGTLCGSSGCGGGGGSGGGGSPDAGPNSSYSSPI